MSVGRLSQTGPSTQGYQPSVSHKLFFLARSLVVSLGGEAPAPGGVPWAVCGRILASKKDKHGAIAFRIIITAPFARPHGLGDETGEASAINFPPALLSFDISETSFQFMQQIVYANPTLSG